MVNAHSGLLNKTISIKGIAKALFVLYVITLFVMVDNPTLNAISEIVFVLYAFFTILYVIQRNRLSLGNCRFASRLLFINLCPFYILGIR